jgi:hypothetical protein
MPHRTRPFRRLSTLLAILPLLVLLALPGRAGAESALWVAVDQAPMRIWRAAEAEVVLRLPRGAVVTPLYAQGAWTRVREPGGQEGWVYQGHLSSTALPPALADVFDPAPPSMILAEAADSARSTRSQGPPQAEGAEALRAALGPRLTPDDLDEFLSQGGIGEFAPAKLRAHTARASFPALRPAAPAGGEDERQVGLNLAAMALRRVGKPVFGNALTRYVNLVGLAVARFAPGNAVRFHAVVLELKQPVSFSLPGGVVMVSTGLLDALENEAQLACVLAHETAHASLGHLWARALNSQFFRSGPRTADRVDKAGAATPQFAAMLEDLFATALVRGLDRDMEQQADQAAVEMAWRAGYAPQQLPKAIARIEEAGRAYAPRNEPKTWTALHPQVAERLAQLQKLLVTLPAAEGLALNTARYQGAIR